MKKILFTLLLLTPFIFFIDEVNAETLPKPSTIEIENQSYGLSKYYTFTGDNIRTIGWYDLYGYATTINDSGLIGFMDSRQNFWYDDLCKGKEISIDVTTLAYYSPGNFYEQSGNLKLWNGEVATTCSLKSTSWNGNVSEWSCYGVITDRVLLTFENIAIGSTEYYNLAIYTGSSYKCDATNSDILNNLTTIGDKITTNQNQNTQDIINNQNTNQAQTNEKLDNLNQNITNDNIDSSSAGGFFSDYQDNDYGLSSVITAPLQFIQNLNSNTCTDLTLPIPFVNQNATLPCMTNIYNKHFGSVFTLYQTITTGFIAYWVAVRIFALVKGFKDPEDDKIEVMDL